MNSPEERARVGLRPQLSQSCALLNRFACNPAQSSKPKGLRELSPKATQARGIAPIRTKYLATQVLRSKTAPIRASANREMPLHRARSARHLFLRSMSGCRHWLELNVHYGACLFHFYFFLFENEVFGVDDARRLSTLVSRKAFGARKVFFVTPERLTLEAQNALLKTLEEPTPDTHILITLRERELLIPTLLSRMQVVEVGKLSEEKEEGPIKFIGMSLTDRLAFAREFADKGFSLPVFLDNLLVLLRAKNG